MNFGGFFKPKNCGTHQKSLAGIPWAVPMVGALMNAGRGATDVFSGVRTPVNNALRKMGAKRIEVGMGCGVGFGHGFGVGLAVKPGVLQKIQIFLIQEMTKMMTKFGVAPNLSIGQGALPLSMQSGTSAMNGPAIQNPLGSITQLATRLPDQTSQGILGYGNMSPHASSEHSSPTSSLVDTPFGSRTEKVLSSFLQNPILKEEDNNLSEVAGRLRCENNLLQTVLKHQQVIEELVAENEKLRQILVEDLKISPSKLQSGYSTRNKSTCADCFECRRKQRKR
ncbi:uncharacterized protein LOC105632335 isoform X2 [Jatropha curcas]|uniref:uncharacterized protein LOC105632335 isoform X2 n=1 Tax=Jatropha curcas TaxID=180498 RepID=UPI0005FC3235|nr:uncharacterized protein LOC105632335 isoform X2 [Jatropha curcas]